MAMAMPCSGISKKVTTSLPSLPADVDAIVSCAGKYPNVAAASIAAVLSTVTKPLIVILGLKLFLLISAQMVVIQGPRSERRFATVARLRWSDQVSYRENHRISLVLASRLWGRLSSIWLASRSRF